MSNRNRQQSKSLTTQDIEKEILYWNINALNNVSAYSSLIDRQQTKQKPVNNDFILRDFYFMNKLTIDGKFQNPTFIEKSISFMNNFKSFDRSTYLLSLNTEKNIQKYRFWADIHNNIPQSKQQSTLRDQIRNYIWGYRLPVFIVYGGLAYTLMFATGITKLNRSKSIAILTAAALVGDYFIQRRKSSHIFYQIKPIQGMKKLEKRRKQLVNESIVLDGHIYDIKQKNMTNQELLQLAAIQENDLAKKGLLEAAGFDVISKLEDILV